MVFGITSVAVAFMLVLASMANTAPSAVMYLPLAVMAVGLVVFVWVLYRRGKLRTLTGFAIGLLLSYAGIATVVSRSQGFLGGF